jgi:hypothetical protein
VNPGKWLRSSSFRLALIYMTLFGGSVLLLLTFIYWSTARYMAQQADATIEAGIAGLAERYRTSGLSGLTNTISERYSIYLLADEDFRPLVGNISRWPPGRATQEGWLDFRLEGEGWPAGENHRARARAFQLRGGFHLLVGRDLRLGTRDHAGPRSYRWLDDDPQPGAAHRGGQSDQPRDHVGRSLPAYPHESLRR